jgi:toxin ParE1/3/4
MENYKLSQQAEQDFSNLFQYGVVNFGLVKAERFIDGMTVRVRFENIAKNPLILPIVDESLGVYRRSVFGRYSIYYRADDFGVVVIRILSFSALGRVFNISDLLIQESVKTY